MSERATDIPLDTIPDQDLVDSLMNQFHAQELRDWMAAHDLSRERGANKRRSAELAVQQDHDGIAQFLLEQNAISINFDRRCMYYDICGNTTPSPREEMCTDCLDYSRQNNFENTIDFENYDSMTAYMAAIHAHYNPSR